MSSSPAAELDAFLDGLADAGVVPLTEEVFFRLVFQGWMEKCFSMIWNCLWHRYEEEPDGHERFQRDYASVFVGGRTTELVSTNPPAMEPTNHEFVQAELVQEAVDERRNPPVELVSANPYASPVADAATTSPDSALESDKAAEPPHPVAIAVSIFFSAAIFALLHWGHGPDPVPLFFLAVGLGYLYSCTHRIVPCIVVHFLVNSLSMIALIAFLLSGQEPP